jgi:UDP-N-acetylmuramate--alanine ligase
MIGVGGCGMCGAADVLLAHGAIVSGSDQASFEGLGHLTARGAAIFIGHGREQLDERVNLVVISAAVPETNPELAEARRRGLRVLKYAELVGELMKGCRGVAVAGTHGKSTTTALTAFLFREAGVGPSFIIGARSDQLGGGSGAGAGPHFIVEACEFDRSFLNFHPECAVILNVEPDHLDCYRDFDEIVEAFAAFGRQVARDGLLVCNGEDAGTRRVTESVDMWIETFGFAEGVDWRAVNLHNDHGRFSFDVLYRGEHYLSTGLSIPGRHNVSNALASIAISHFVGLGAGSVADSIRAFSGVSRRLTQRSVRHGVVIVDDYAHHPTEIRVTIGAARDRYQPRRTWVIFQPHQQSRTRHFMDDFAASFSQADEIIVPDIYGAREAGESDRAAGSQELVSRIRQRGGQATYLPLREVTDHLTRHVADGDMILTMGAGDVWKVADELVARMG